MLVVNKMCIMTSKFIILHFKGAKMFTIFSDEGMAKCGKYFLKRVSFGSKECTQELKPECAYFLGQTS